MDKNPRGILRFTSAETRTKTEVPISTESVPRASDEIVYYRGQVSGLLPVFQTVKATAILAAIIYLLTRQFLDPLITGLGDYQSWFWMVILLTWSLYVGWTWWGWGAIQYVLTSKKLTFERGRFAKSIKNIELWRVRELLFHRSFFESLFGIGKITLVSKDVTGPFSVVGPIMNARHVYESLNDAREVAIKERGVMAVES
jgi:hypothetical protein